jgi:hypothetical protein
MDSRRGDEARQEPERGDGGRGLTRLLAAMVIQAFAVSRDEVLRIADSLGQVVDDAGNTR